MEVYTWNYATSDKEHLAFLKRMKVNWFSLDNPKFKVEGDNLTCDFRDTDTSLAAVKEFGKGMFIFSALGSFSKELADATKIGREDPRYKPLLRQYLTQWMRHMQEKGWKPEDYAIELWDEPGQEGYHDHDWVFELIAESAATMKEVEPRVQVMVNPLMRFNKKWYDTLAGHVAVWCPYGGLVYLKEDTRDKTWDAVNGLDPKDFAQSNLMSQVYFRKMRAEHGCRLWTYFQRQPTVQNGIVYYRHFPWKDKWMGFDGVSFWSSWYATGGALENPIYLGVPNWEAYAVKGVYGWRDGVEDVQYLELLEDAVAQCKAQSPDRAEALDKLLYAAQKRVADTGWWASTPELLESAINQSRREIAQALQKP
jgi:hypothetical protein